jgi:hypothetical protein
MSYEQQKTERHYYERLQDDDGQQTLYIIINTHMTFGQDLPCNQIMVMDWITVYY